MKPLNLNNVQGESGGGFDSLPAGVYKCVITDTEDYENNESLRITVDIAEGEFESYFSNDPFYQGKEWAHSFFISYSDNDNFGNDNTKQFAWALEAITEASPGFDAKAAIAIGADNLLVGKFVLVAFRQEEYFAAKTETFEIGTTARPFKIIKAEEREKFAQPKTKMMTDNQKRRALERAGINGAAADAIIKGEDPAQAAATASLDEDLPF